MPTALAITTHTDCYPADLQRISHRPEPPISIVEYNPLWPSQFLAIQSRIRDLLGDKALEINHVGSTSVPGLPARPVIDVEIVVADPTDENSYAAALESNGGATGQGFQFLLREPAWHQHRFFYCEEPYANVHVFGPHCPEVVRHRIFSGGMAGLPATHRGWNFGFSHTEYNQSV